MFLEDGMWIDERVFSSELLSNFYLLILLNGPDKVLAMLKEYVELDSLDAISGGDTFVS